MLLFPQSQQHALFYKVSMHLGLMSEKPRTGAGSGRLSRLFKNKVFDGINVFTQKAQTNSPACL